MSCSFRTGGTGRCDNQTVKRGRCETHLDVRCSQCGALATHGCEYMIYTHCEMPLCDRHDLCHLH